MANTSNYKPGNSNVPSEERLNKVFENVDPSTLSEEDWTAVFYLHSDEYFEARRKDHPDWPTIVAEGDSWFEYPLRHEIVHYLKRVDGFHVKSVSHHGIATYEACSNLGPSDVRPEPIFINRSHLNQGGSHENHPGVCGYPRT